MKREVLVGLVIGILVSLISPIGLFVCNWNPVEGSVVPDGLCRSPLQVFYVPVIPQSLILYSFNSPLYNLVLATIAMNLITIVEFVLLSIIALKIYRWVKR